MLTEGKYPRTYHYSFSLGTENDDRINSNWWVDIKKIIKSDLNKLDLSKLIHTEKLDGENCCSEEVLLLTEFDGYKSIRWICENKYDGRVLTYDTFTEIEEYQQILNWQILDNNDDWYELILHDGKKIKLTGNHLVWLPDLMCYRRVNLLKEDDNFLLKK